MFFIALPKDLVDGAGGFCGTPVYTPFFSIWEFYASFGRAKIKTAANLQGDSKMDPNTI
jgi:hypothetical protein